MVWKLTAQQLAYGKQHMTYLSNNAACPMKNSKIAVSGGNPTPIGIVIEELGTDNWSGAWNGYYGAYQGHRAKDLHFAYRIQTLKRFVPVEFQWCAQQYSGKGWGTRPARIYLCNQGAQILVWDGGIVSLGRYGYTIPDDYLLNWDLSSPDSWVYFWWNIKTSGAAQHIVQIRGFQTPYPNMAAFKDSVGNINWPLQTIGYKDDAGVVKTAGRLL